MSSLATPQVADASRLRLHRVAVRCAFGLALIASSSSAAAQPASGPPPSSEPSPDPDPQVAALAQANAQLAADQKQLADLAARDAELAKQIDEARTAQHQLAAALDREREERLAAMKSTPPGVRSAWPQLTLGGFFQVDAALRQSSEDELKQSGDLLNQDRVYLRRGRPKITAAYGKVGGVIEIDINTINGGQVRPSAVEATYQATPWLRAGLGIAKIPFGFEVEQSDRERLFLERSNAERGLFPGEYDTGAKLSGAWRFLRYAIAAQNGEPVGEKGFTLRDPNQAKDITARFGVDTTSGDLSIAGGFSFLTGRGFHAGTPATKDVLVWRDLNEDGLVSAGEIQVIAGQAATPSASFDRFALGADLELALDLHDYGRVLLYGELVAASNLDRATVIADPVASGRDFRELGWYVAAIAEPVAWAAVGARYDLYDPDADASELRTGNVVPVDQSMSTFAITGALKHEHGRLILEYDHNRNHNGRSTVGVPTNLGDDAITLRAEIQL
ncbi:MAG TPA: hypothetical protein VIV58_13690 [Kofleriaceae bacterium]